MRLANVVLQAVHCNYFVGYKQKDMYELYAVIQNRLLALYEHFIHICCLETYKPYKQIHVYVQCHVYLLQHVQQPTL